MCDISTANEFELPDGTPLPTGSLILNGLVHGWTGTKCTACYGTGCGTEDYQSCNGCGGTGEYHGPMYRWEE